MQQIEALEDAAWSYAFGIASTDQAVILDGDRPGWRASLERLLARVDDVLGTNGNGEVSDLRTTACLIGVRMQLEGAIEELEELGDAPLVDEADRAAATARTDSGADDGHSASGRAAPVEDEPLPP